MTDDSSIPASDAALAEFIADAVGFELPDQCEAGVLAAWRTLAMHWASLAGDNCDE